MSLKKAAPGAPFGWTSDGSPYVGTQYAVRSKPGAGLQLQFASLSTRNGAPQFYWKPLVGVSAKVALSALETHGSVSALLAGESMLPVCDIFEADQVAAVRAAFVRLLGEAVLSSFETADEAEEAKCGGGPSGSTAAPLKAEEAPPSAPAKSEAESSAVGQKRKARMALADGIKLTTSKKSAMPEMAD